MFHGDERSYETDQRTLRQIMKMHEESEITIVHTGETRVLQRNPDTSEEVHEQLPDGNVRTIVRPKGEAK